MKITYWSDYACPYCYIGEVRLKKAIDELRLNDIELEMKAFQLDPTAAVHSVGDTQTRFAHKYGISYEEAGNRISEISNLGIAEGLDFKYATTLFTNTMDAHRLTKLAQSKGSEIADKITERLFKAYFTENKELADKAVLQQIGEECGLEQDEVKELLAGDKFKAEVISDEQEAQAYGVHAVPFFIVAEKYAVPGAYDKDSFKQLLLKIVNNSETNAAVGMSCGPDGCH